MSDTEPDASGGPVLTWLFVGIVVALTGGFAICAGMPPIGVAGMVFAGLVTYAGAGYARNKKR